MLLLQLFPAKICYPFGKKSILCLLFASKVSNKLTLKEYQITKSIRKFVPNAQLIVGSYFYFLQEEEAQIRFFYLEMEKSDGYLFSRKEVALLKENLEDWFDHTLLVAEDDPDREHLLKLGELGLAKITEVAKTGCEGISDFLYEYINTIMLPEYGEGDRVWCSKVEVRETASNMAMRIGHRSDGEFDE